MVVEATFAGSTVAMGIFFQEQLSDNMTPRQTLDMGITPSDPLATQGLGPPHPARL